MIYLALLIGLYLMIANLQQGIYTQSEWEAFKLKYEKIYENEHVESMRKAIFFDNKQKIDQFRQTPESKYYSVALNSFADMSNAEMMSWLGLELPNDFQTRSRNSPEACKFLNDILNDNSTEVPDKLDWRQVPGRVSKVKNQKRCRSCWAFAATGTLEGQEKVTMDVSSIIELSEQNLLDCLHEDADECYGDLVDNAFELIRKQGGISDEQSYPYEGKKYPCRFNGKKVAFSISGAAILPEGDEQTLKKVVAKFGPVAAAFHVSKREFALYKDGIYYDPNSDKRILNHAVLVVGYGTDPEKGDYWIIKNSWGSGWGDQGYFKAARNRNNMSGIATRAVIPIF